MKSPGASHHVSYSGCALLSGGGKRRSPAWNPGLAKHEVCHFERKEGEVHETMAPIGLATSKRFKLLHGRKMGQNEMGPIGHDPGGAINILSSFVPNTWARSTEHILQLCTKHTHIIAIDQTPALIGWTHKFP